MTIEELSDRCHARGIPLRKAHRFSLPLGESRLRKQTHIEIVAQGEGVDRWMRIGDADILPEHEESFLDDAYGALERFFVGEEAMSQ